MGKTDSTGTYSYACDGASPGSPVLSDGHALYTPGLSENRNGTSRYYANDRLGNLWTIDGTAKSQLTYEDFSGFGGTIAGGTGGSPFGYGGGNGCQTDADTGVVLMGHRYYDTRIGRFISQDPAGDGDNWYEYADNSPVNEVDPEGLMPMDGPGSSPVGSPGYNDVAGGISNIYSYTGASLSSLGYWTHGEPDPIHPYNIYGQLSNEGGEVDTDWVPDMTGPQIAGDFKAGPDGKSIYRTDMGEADGPDMHIYHNGDPHGPETNIDQNGKLRLGKHRGRELKELPKKLKKVYRPAIKTFLQRAGMAADAIEAALDGLTLDIPIFYFDPKVGSMYSNPQGGA